MGIDLVSFRDRIDGTYNPSLFTPWTFFHFLFGWLFYFSAKILMPSWRDEDIAVALLILHTGYELKDYYVAYELRLTDYNSLVNSFGDTLSVLLGLWIATHFKPRLSMVVALTVVLTIFLYLDTKIELD